MNAGKPVALLMIGGACAIGLATMFRDEIRAFLEQQRAARPTESRDAPAEAIAPMPADRMPRPGDLHHPRPGEIPAAYAYSVEAFARYRAWIDQSIKDSHDRPVIIVDKLAHVLELWIDGEKKEVFPVDLGRDPINDKFIQGDGATPEGRYRISWVRDVGQTRYYRAYLLDYPSPLDLDELKDLKARNRVEASASPGGHIEIHGHGGMGFDWTLGCIALSNDAMDRLFSHDIQEGTPVTIVRYGTQLPDAISRR